MGSWWVRALQSDAMTTRFEHMAQGAACAALLILTAACAGPEPRVTPAGTESPAASATDAVGDKAMPEDPKDGSTPKDESAAGDGEATSPDDAPDKAQSKAEPSPSTLVAEAHRVVDDWHDAAARGDRNRYLDHFGPTAIFLGTDASERWDLAGFTVYVDENFKPGRGWAYTPSKRHVVLGPGKDIAWFDEELESSGYGALRGTGALARNGDTWRIVLYSMTFTIPNEISGEVVDLVRASGR